MYRSFLNCVRETCFPLSSLKRLIKFTYLILSNLGSRKWEEVHNIHRKKIFLKQNIEGSIHCKVSNSEDAG